jgi:hypothetical protein
MTDDQLEILARRAGAAVRHTTKEIPVTLTDITGTDADQWSARRRRPRSVLAAAAVVMLLVVGGLTWLLSTDQDPDPAPPAEPDPTVSIAGEIADVRVTYARAWQVHPWGQDVLHQDQIEPVPAADLADYLAEVPALEVGGLREIAVDGRPATQVDLAVPTPRTVRDVSRAELFCLGTTGNYCHPVVSDVQTNRYVIIPVENGAVVVIAEAAQASSAEAYEAMEQVLGELRITP